jgi:hypothetical protein
MVMRGSAQASPDYHGSGTDGSRQPLGLPGPRQQLMAADEELCTVAMLDLPVGSNPYLFGYHRDRPAGDRCAGDREAKVSAGKPAASSYSPRATPAPTEIALTSPARA